MKFLRHGGLLAGLGLSATFSTILQAAVEFDNGLVPVELAREGNGGNYYSSLPDNFPVPVIPPSLGLSVIGSIDRGRQQQLLLRNTAPGDIVRAALQAAYEAQGWISFPLSPQLLTLCHDGFGTLQIHSTDGAPGESRTHVVRSTYPVGSAGEVNPTCAEQLQNIQTGGTSGVFGFLQTLMPVLESPAGAERPPIRPYIGPALGIRGIRASVSGRNVEMTNEGSIEIADVRAAELYQHFAEQLEEQGWAVDSDSVGERSSSSVWLKLAAPLPIPGAPEADHEYALVMTLLNTSGDIWRVTVKMQAGDGSGIGFSSNSPIGMDVIERDLFF